MGVVAKSAGMVPDTVGGNTSVGVMAEGSNVPVQFWLVVAASLVWNGCGAVDHVLTSMRDAAYLANFPSGLGLWPDHVPNSAATLWAIGVWGSLAGALLMLVRSRHAGIAFMVSFLAVATAYCWQFAQDLPAGVDSFGFNMMAATVLLGTFCQWWYARSMFWYEVLR